MGEVMTKHSVARWYHLAIAAVVPLVLTVCATPTSISQLGDLDLDVDAPSSTALATVEPEAPVLPLIEVAAAPQAVQPALDAGLLGVGGVATVTPHIEPVRPPHPERSELLASVPMSALGEPAAPATEHGAGVVRGRAGLVPPTTPPHPVMVAAVPVSLTYPQPASAVGPSIIQPPTDTDFDQVRVLIARAEEVGAQFYDPQNLDGAREALGTTERIRGVDPGRSHVGLRVAEAQANAAFENSVRLAAERLRKLLRDRLEELREIRADLWVPVSFQELVDAVAAD